MQNSKKYDLYKIINEKIYNLNFNNAVLFDFDTSKKNIIEKINFIFKLKNV